jgi:hypothetical protein
MVIGPLEQRSPAKPPNKPWDLELSVADVGSILSPSMLDRPFHAGGHLAAPPLWNAE